MNQKVYRYGVFPFGLGRFGIGPIIEEDDNNMIVQYGTEQSIYTSLTQYGDVSLMYNPTIVAGDVQISKDGGAFTTITTNPYENPAGSSQIKIELTIAETTAKQCIIRFKDQTVPPRWNDKIVSIETYGNSSAYIIDNFDGVTSASNFITTDVSSLATSAQVALIPIDNNGITVSANNAELPYLVSAVNYITSQIDNTSYGLSAIRAKQEMLVSDVLGSNIDGLTMDEALTRILAWATGKTIYVNSEFTYYKQDDATVAFVLSATDTQRVRV